MKEALQALATDFLNDYPSFEITEQQEDSFTVEGVFLLDAEYKVDAEHEPKRLADCYRLQIIVYEGFPGRVPTVRELSAKIPLEYRHIYQDGSFCLGIGGEIAYRLTPDGTLSDLLKGPITAYLYTAKYFFLYDRFPFGERAHGKHGILDSYCEIFEVETEEKAEALLKFAATGEYRGHLECPCGSGRKLRDCHGPKILEIKGTSTEEAFRQDYGYCVSDDNECRPQLIKHRNQKSFLIAAEWYSAASKHKSSPV